MEKKEAIQIVQVPVQDLKPSEYNPRMASEKEVNDLTESITKFGLVDPIIVNSAENRKNIVIGGHFRLRVATEMGFTDMPVIYRNLPNIEDEKELNLRLNFNSGSFDYDLLANFDEDMLIDVGFTPAEIDNIFELDIKPEDDDIPENPPAITKLGDIYQLGRHRVMCGDSTKIEDVDKLMGGKKADMVFTDPPYSVNYTKKNKEILKSKDYCEIKNDDLSIKEISETIWKPVFKNMYDVSKNDCSFYMTMPQGGDQMMMMMMMMMSENWKVKHELIWVKESPVFSMGRLDYDYQHEPIMYGWKDKHNFYGKGEFTKSIWNIKRDGKKQHPTMKPVALIENALLNSSQRGEICLDLFLGSGSTLIACEKTNRICYGMEIDPHYCDVVVNRWEQYTGQKAEVLNG